MQRLAVLSLLALAACEGPEPPARCADIPQVTVNAGETATVAACFNDPNGDALVYSATSSNPGVATTSISGTDITVAAVAPGRASVTVTASDPGGLQAEQNFSVEVPNRAPQPRGAIPPATVPVGQTATVDASSYFTEPDGEALVYSATSSDRTVATVSMAGTAGITVTAVAKGDATVTVTARDPGGLTASQGFLATVPNRAPEPVGTIADREVAADAAAEVDVAGHFTDPDGDVLYYAASSSSPANVRVSVSGSVVTVSGVAKGSAAVTVTARDPGELTASQGFMVTVTIPDRAVLEELYDALGGSDWTTNTNWLTDADLATWYGVTTNEAKRVVRLELQANGLTGTIPPELGSLSRLERLYVHENRRLSGPLPLALEGLPLDWFHYSGTNLCVPPKASFRTWLDNIPNHSGTGVDCLRRLTNNGDDDLYPAWSPDGTEIAFYSDRDDNWEVYAMDADGSNQTRLTNNRALDGAPAWSRSGDSIAFESNRDGNWEIYVMDADGSDQERLTNNSDRDEYPEWSPDGTEIAFHSNRDGNWEVYLMDADGSNQDNLTNNSAWDALPAWSPDGTEIVFMSRRDGDFEIYVMQIK
ncbi:MAG: Ig-like domain-containing protein [Gemmatimonadota bacterium]|nr:Ig-like domain-containing protein [Gemmatimonadota bacterium]